MLRLKGIQNDKWPGDKRSKLSNKGGTDNTKKWICLNYIHILSVNNNHLLNNKKRSSI